MKQYSFLDVLRYVRESRQGRRYIDFEREFTEDRGWAKATFIKYWKEAKPYLEKKQDPKQPSRFRYFLKKQFTNMPEEMMLKQQIVERNDATLQQSHYLPQDIIQKYVNALGKVIEENVYGNPFNAWRLLTNISETTPDNFKTKFKPYLLAARKVYDEQTQYHDPLEKTYFVKNNIIPFLLDKFSSLLYGGKKDH